MDTRGEASHSPEGLPEFSGDFGDKPLAGLYRQLLGLPVLRVHEEKLPE